MGRDDIGTNSIKVEGMLVNTGRGLVGCSMGRYSTGGLFQRIHRSSDEGIYMPELVRGEWKETKYNNKKENKMNEITLNIRKTKNGFIIENKYNEHQEFIAADFKGVTSLFSKIVAHSLGKELEPETEAVKTLAYSEVEKEVSIYKIN